MDNYYRIITYIMFGIVGLCVGSFLNVVIYRLPRGMNLAKPASHCPTCDHELAWYDNIPLFSYIFLKGKCRYCRTKITPRYFIVELLNAIVWILCVFTFYKVDNTYLMNLFVVGVNALAVSVLITIALCDAENMFIPDSLQIAFLILAIGNVFTNTSLWQEKLFGILAGGGSFLLFYLLSFLLFKKEGLGLGDVKLMAIAGLYLGWKNVFVAIVISVFSALIIGVILRLINAKKIKQTNCNIETQEETISGKDDNINENVDNENVVDSSKNDVTSSEKGIEFPFAPYLAFGILISMFLGTAIINAYMSLFTL